MPTIKDIAKAAGVSHATVSNVLNHKGIVSAEKVKLVQDTARAMGYRINEAASALRSGKARVLAVILPDIQSAAHEDLFKSLRDVAAQYEYGVMLRVTDNVPALERRAVHDVLSARAECVVAVTSLGEPDTLYAELKQAGVRIRMALRGAQDADGYVGFDMAEAARQMAKRVQTDGAKRVGLMTNMLTYPAEKQFHDSFIRSLPALPVQAVQSIASRYVKQAFDLVQADAVVTTCEEMAAAILSASQCLGLPSPKVYTLAAQRTLPDARVTPYQLNYRQLGRVMAEQLLHPGAASGALLPASGFPSPVRCSGGESRMLHLLSIENPSTDALRQLTPLLKQQTGITLSITTLPTAAVTQALAQSEALKGFDLLRMDMALMDCYAKQLFEPLDSLYGILPELKQEYALVDGMPYALPLDPSCHVLFYRQDMFDSPRFQRAYYERYGEALALPATFTAYARVAEFFDSFAAETGARGALNSQQTSECMAHFVAMSKDGAWPQLTDAELAAYIDTRRRLEAASLPARDGNWNHTVDLFARGESAMMIAHANYAERLAHNPLYRVSGRVGFARVPGDRPLLGGGVVGITRTCTQKDAAREFLAWLYSDSTAMLTALLGGCSPCAAPYENDEVLDMYPWLRAVRQGLTHGVRRGLFPNARRPFHQLHLEEGIALTCLSAVNGVLTPQQALQNIDKAYPAT